METGDGRGSGDHAARCYGDRRFECVRFTDGWNSQQSGTSRRLRQLKQGEKINLQIRFKYLDLLVAR